MAAISPQDRPEQARILVIDDEAGPRESLRFLLKDQYRVLCADSVDAGLDVLHAATVDLIILDLKMPGKTGILGLEEIRAIDPLVSIVMLTGFASIETAQQALRLGATDYLKKPFDVTEMRTAVAGYVARTRAERLRHATVAELQTLNERLQTSLLEKERLAELGKASNELVHDLRSPLTVICGYTQLLRLGLNESGQERPPDAGEWQAYLEQIENSAERCREMAEIWQNLNRPRRDRLDRCDLHGLLRDVAAALSPEAAKNGIAIEVEPVPSDELTVAQGDPLQLFRALQNLVNNALQAVPPSHGRVRLAARRVDGELEVTIRDNGPGLAPELVDEIFNPNVSTRLHQGGMGLGLFITREIVSAHGGSVGLRNEEAGTCAWLRLPASE